MTVQSWQPIRSQFTPEVAINRQKSLLWIKLSKSSDWLVIELSTSKHHFETKTFDCSECGDFRIVTVPYRDFECGLQKRYLSSICHYKGRFLQAIFHTSMPISIHIMTVMVEVLLRRRRDFFYISLSNRSNVLDDAPLLFFFFILIDEKIFLKIFLSSHISHLVHISNHTKSLHWCCWLVAPQAPHFALWNHEIIQTTLIYLATLPPFSLARFILHISIEVAWCWHYCCCAATPGAQEVCSSWGGGAGQDSMACNYLQLIEYEKLIMYLSSGARHATYTPGRIQPSVCEGQLFAVPPEKLLGFRLLLWNLAKTKQ